MAADTISFARGAPSADILPREAVRDAAAIALAEDWEKALSYGTGIGHPGLCQWIAERHGDLDAGQVMVANGSLEAGAMLFEHLLKPGDRVVVEQPTYDRTLLMLQRLGVELVPVELEADGLYLTGTSEVSLAALHTGEILDAGELPLRYTGFSTNFRRESGAAGRDTRGMFRVHQFNKVEMFVFVEPDTSWDEHERMLDLEERYLQALGLPYRVMNVAAGDLGASAAKKYDIEAWFPFQERYREVTSCSNTTDFQARRLGIRHRTAGGGLETPHTLNGTMVTDRALLAILENFGGGVPDVLTRYGAPAEIRPS